MAKDTQSLTLAEYKDAKLIAQGCIKRTIDRFESVTGKRVLSIRYIWNPEKRVDLEVKI